MGTRVFSCNDFSLNTATAKPRTDNHPLHAFQLCGNVISLQLFAIHKVQTSFYIIIDARQVQTLTDTLIGVLQVVLAHQCDVHLARRLALLV